MLFSAGGALQTSSSNDKSDLQPEGQTLKKSFLSQKKPEDEKKGKKQSDYKTRGTQLKDSKKAKVLAKIKTSENDVFDKVSSHRYSEQTKSTLIKTPQKDVEVKKR